MCYNLISEINLGGHYMPIVNIKMLEGRTVDEKRAIAQKVTQAFVDASNMEPEWVTIIFEDMLKHDFAQAGVLTSDK